jgi:hypothetical protein
MAALVAALISVFSSVMRLAEMQVLAKPLVNRQPSLVHLEIQPMILAEAAVQDKLALHVLIDYQLHAKS